MNRSIAIISNINANKYALEAFLTYIDKEKIDYVFNLGNFISEGPNPCEIFDKVTTDKRFINIIGKKEFDILNEEYGGVEYGYKISHEEWIRERLGYNRLKRLENISKSNISEVNGKKILAVANKVSNYDLWEEPILGTIYKDESINELNKNKKCEYDYVLYLRGSIRELITYNFWGAMTIISPGSICCFKDNLISFAVINFENGQEEVSFKTIEYDRNKFIRDMYENDVPGKTGIFWGVYKINSIDEILCREEELKKYLQLEGSAHLEMIKVGEVRDKDYFCSFLKSLISWAIKKSEYVSFGCWEGQESIIKEIIEVIGERLFKKEVMGEQIYIKTNIEKDIKDFILNKSINDKGNFKWFDLHFYSYLNTDQYNLMIMHNGTEIYLEKLNKTELEFIRSIINYDETTIRIY